MVSPPVQMNADLSTSAICFHAPLSVGGIGSRSIFGLGGRTPAAAAASEASAAFPVSVSFSIFDLVV